MAPASFRASSRPCRVPATLLARWFVGRRLRADVAAICGGDLAGRAEGESDPGQVLGEGHR